MSGIAGVVHLDGRPADRDLVSRMTEALAHRGPDAEGIWTGGPAGLGHRMLVTTPEALAEKQPWTDRSGSIALVLDGRVDNREELRRALAPAGRTLRNDTDAELVLASYEAWGEACPERILGDFAFAIWDSGRRMLFAARDRFGMRPFHYHEDGRAFRFASEIRGLLADPEVPREPDEGFAGELLACCVASTDATLLRGIHRLPPAHRLVAGPRGARVSRYWDFDPGRTVRFARDEEYAERFLELFREAVRCRLRATGPVGIELSGGLDSSSVASVARSLALAGEAPGIPLEAFSLVFPGLECDETPYIREVVKRWNLVTHELPPAHRDASFYTERASISLDFPDYPNGAMLGGIMRLARERGVRVLLTGQGGDEWLTGSHHHHADLVRAGRVTESLRRLAVERRSNAVIFPGHPFLRLGLRPLLPRALRRTIRALLGRGRPPVWIEPAFARRIDIAGRIASLDKPRRFPTFAQEGIYRAATHPWVPQMSEVHERSVARFGIEERHPLGDVRIAEFGIALPEDWRWRGGETKLVLRRALSGLLPEEVLARRDKADFSHTIAEAMEEAGGEEFFRSLEITERGWVDCARLLDVYRKMASLFRGGDERYTLHTWPLAMTFGIEHWHRMAFGRARAPSLARSATS